MFYVYILKTKVNGSYYIGSCANLEARVTQHNDRLVPSTKRYAPWRLVYFEKYDILSRARKRELQIKKWKSRKAIEKLVKHFENLR